MKKILFAILLLSGLAANCQGLTPRIYGNGTDTVFAFSRLQIKAVTKLIVKGQFDAQTIHKQQTIIADLEKKSQVSKVLIGNLYAEIDMHRQTITQRDSALAIAGEVIHLKDGQLMEKEAQITGLQKKKRINRRLTLVLAILTFVVGTQL